MWHHWWISAMIFSSHLVGSSSSPPSSEEEELFPSRSCTGCQLRRIKLSSEICSRTGKALVGLSAFGSCDDDSARSDMDKHSSPTWNSSGAAALAGDDGTGFSIFQCGGTCGGGGSVKGASCRPTRTRTKAIQLDLFSLESSGDAPSPFSDAWSEKGENQREERINKMSRNGRSSSRRRRRGGGGRGKGYRLSPPSSAPHQVPPPKVSLELIEHLSCACSTQLPNQKRTKRSRDTRSANEDKAVINNSDKVTPPTTIPAASSRDSDTTLGTTNAKMSGNLTILSNSNYYQTCLACKEQAEICEGRKNIDDS